MTGRPRELGGRAPLQPTGDNAAQGNSSAHSCGSALRCSAAIQDSAELDAGTGATGSAEWRRRSSSRGLYTPSVPAKASPDPTTPPLLFNHRLPDGRDRTRCPFNPPAASTRSLLRHCLSPQSTSHHSWPPLRVEPREGSSSHVGLWHPPQRGHGEVSTASSRESFILFPPPPKPNCTPSSHTIFIQSLYICANIMPGTAFPPPPVPETPYTPKLKTHLGRFFHKVFSKGGKDPSPEPKKSPAPGVDSPHNENLDPIPSLFEQHPIFSRDIPIPHIFSDEKRRQEQELQINIRKATSVGMSSPRSTQL